MKKSFRTARVRYVPASLKYDVEREYGMSAKSYGAAIEIDHVVSLELVGSNDIANLYAEPGTGALSYHAKDALENKLHELICGGTLKLSDVRQRIAVKWTNLYAKVFKQ